MILLTVLVLRNGVQADCAQYSSQSECEKPGQGCTWDDSWIDEPYDYCRDLDILDCTIL